MAEVSIDSQSPEDKIAETLRTAKFEAYRCLRSLALDTSDNRPAYVYALFRPDGSIRYVGKGTKSRIKDHGKFGANHYNKRLAADYVEYGELLARKVISKLTNDEAYAAEIHLIAYWGIEADGGGPLANGDYGGGGGADLSEEARAKITAHNLSVWADGDERKRRSEAMRAAWTDERKAAAGEMVRERWRDEARLARRIAASKETWANSPESREKISQLKKAMWADEEKAALMKAKRKATMATPESKAKRSASNSKRFADPEARARHSAAVKAGLAKRKSNLI